MDILKILLIILVKIVTKLVKHVIIQPLIAHLATLELTFFNKIVY